MHILIYGINFFPELTGIGKYSAEFASFLVTQGVEVRVITAPPYYPEWQIHTGYTSWRYQKQTWGGMHIIRCPLWVPRKKGGLQRILHLLSFALSSFPAALSQLAWKPDLVFAVAPALTSAPFAWLLGRLVGARTWLHLQDLEVDAAMGLGIVRKGMLARLVYELERWILQRFDHLSTISNAMAQRVQAKGILPGNISLFPNWVDCDQIYPLPSSHIRKELGISEQACVVLYAGNMGEKQGLEVLLQAAYHLAEHAEIQFVFCGDGAQREVLQAQAQAQAVSNVKFLPLQPLDQLNELLNLADIHVLPQRKGAAGVVMPSKLTGMLASGKAVIVTAEEDTELGALVKQVGVLVPPEDPHALAEAIGRLSNDPATRELLGEKGRQFALTNLSAQYILNNVFEKML
jgi:colanic acid biosynthesis glycosyl transferase WcaI